MPNLFYYTNPPPRVPFEQVFIYDPLNDVGRYATTVGANGSISIVGDGLEIDSGAVDAQTTKLKRTDQIVPFTMSWAKTRKVRLSFKLEMDDSDYGEAFIGIGDESGTNFVGIHINGPDVAGICQNSGGNTEATIHTLDPGAIDEEIHVLMHLTPGSGVAFYKDGTIQDVVTANLPSGSAHDNDTLYASVVAGFPDPAYSAIKLTVGYLEFTQVK